MNGGNVKKQVLAYILLTALFIVMFLIALRNYNLELALGKVSPERIVASSYLAVPIMFYLLSSIGIVLLSVAKSGVKKVGYGMLAVGIMAAIATWILFEPFTSILSLLIFTASLLVILMLALKMNR